MSDDAIPLMDDESPIELSADPVDDSPMSSTQIQAFGEKQKRHEDAWSRSPNVTGSGAIHVKSFNAKLRPDALAYMDQQINEWLDAHPQYEVKFVTSSVGDLKGKTTEPTLILNVWV